VKFRDFIRILEGEGFKFDRHKDTHHFYVGVVNGIKCVVNCDYNQLGEDIPTHNLASMIRQSGLPKRKFRGG